ncbi:MAG: glycosyltransferase family 4 protein [Oscillospiraceae bacterium]|nr:glycosyltransferase family 4 protein [Oscillospiraceae bacterium]
MIKVMNIISDSNIGGAGRVLINYLRYRDRAQFDLTVVVPEGSALIPEIEKTGARIITARTIAEKSLSLQGVKELRAIIEAEKPDIVHTHGSMSGRIAGKMAGVKVVYTRHSVFPNARYLTVPPGKWANKLFNETFADSIIAVSPAAVDNLTEAGISRGKIEVVMNGVEAVNKVPDEIVKATRERWGVQDGELVVGILARIEEYKGHEDILRAVKTLRHEGVSVRLIIAGTGAYEDSVRRTCSQLGLEDVVVFEGFVSDVAPFLSSIDLQINASWGTEATSMSILEGFSMALPAILSDYGGNPYLSDNGRGAVLFRARDVKDMADKLSLLASSTEKLQSMGAEARELYLSRFTVEEFAKNTENVYRRTMEMH